LSQASHSTSKRGERIVDLTAAGGGADLSGEKKEQLALAIMRRGADDFHKA
jgi:hypothetical protein